MEASRATSRSRIRRSLRLTPLRPKRQAEPAFEELYRDHAREVYQYALAVLANPADAEDVTQTTFLNAYRAFQRGERPRKPHNWLIAIAHNVCRMRWRQAGARPREVALEEAPEPAAPADERPDLDEVLAALARLSFNQRSALVMRELEGRSYREIAEVLNLSVSAVEALLFRARRRLQLDRKALGVLTTVPLPGSLCSFVGAGGTVAAVAGGTIVGADLVLKAAAVVAAGAVTVGAGVKGVETVTGSHPGPELQPRAAAAAPRQAQSAVLSTGGSRADTTATHRKVLRRAHEARTTSASRPRRPTAGTDQLPAAPAATAPPSAASALPSAAAPAASVAAPATRVAPPPPALPVAPAPQAPALPPVPPAPPPPPLPVLPPAPPLPPPPPLPVVPPPPLLPPPPIK